MSPQSLEATGVTPSDLGIGIPQVLTAASVTTPRSGCLRPYSSKDLTTLWTSSSDHDLHGGSQVSKIPIPGACTWPTNICAGKSTNVHKAIIIITTRVFK